MPDEAEGRRLLITAAIGTFDRSPVDKDGRYLWNRPELDADVARMADIFQTRLGYDHVRIGALRLESAEFLDELGRLMRDAGPDDYIVVYLATHGEIVHFNDKSEHRLLTSEADPTNPLTYLKTSDLAYRLVGVTQARRLLFILDTCFSGAGAFDFARESMEQMKMKRSDVGLRDGVGTMVISSSLSITLARAGLFTKAFHNAVLQTWPTGRDRFFQVDRVLSAMQQDPGLETAGQLPQSVSAFAGGEPAFLRIPGSSGAPVYSPEDARDAMREDVTVLREAMQNFVGRQEALQRLKRWLGHPEEPASAAVVWGDIGTGKSAVLGSLLEVRDGARRPDVPDDERASVASPAGPFDVVIHLKTRPTGEITGRIAALTKAGIAAPEGQAEASVESLLRLLRGRNPAAGPLTVMIDAIDEATNPAAVMEQVLAPLIRQGRGVIRLLLGARTAAARHLNELVGAENILQIKLDGDYADPKAMRMLITQRLRPAPWYEMVAEDRLTGIVDVLERHAEGSFFVAGTAADIQCKSNDAPDPDDPTWQASVPRHAAAAVASDFAGREFGEHRTAMLRPLGYAQGRGLTEDLWSRLVTALHPPAANSDLHGEVRSLINDAFSYLVRTGTGDPRYSLAHHAIAEYLTDGRDGRADQRAISEVLLDTVDVRNWAVADPYLKAHLASHAAAGGLIDGLVLDPGFLVHADSLPLLEATRNVSSADARAAAAAYRRALPLLRGADEKAQISYLALGAHEIGAEALVRRITDRYRPMLAAGTDSPEQAPDWLPVWAAWRPDQPHLSLADRGPSLLAIHEAAAMGKIALVSVDVTGMTRIWDPATGILIADTIRAPGDGPPRAVAFLDVDGATKAVTADQANTVWCWDPVDETVEPVPLYTHQGEVTALAACGGDEPLVFSACTAGTLQIWDMTEGIGVESLTTTGVVTAIAATRIDGSVKVAAGGTSQIVTVWDLGHEYPGRHPATFERRHDILALAFAQSGSSSFLLVGEKTNKIDVLAYPAWASRGSLDAGGSQLDYVRSIAVGGGPERSSVVAGGDDRIVRVWDIATLEHSLAPLIGHEGTVTAVGWVTVDGRPCAVSGCSDGTLRVWNAEDYPPPKDPFVGHIRVIRDATVAVVPAKDGADGSAAAAWTVLATASEDQTVRLWDLDTGAPVCRPLTGHADWVGGVAFAHVAGRVLAVSVGGDGKVRVWNVPSGLPDGEPLEGHVGWAGAVAVAERNGAPVALSAGRDGRVLVWDLRTRERLGALETGEEHPKPLRALAVCGPKDAPTVLAAGDDGRVHRWFLPTLTPQDPYEHGPAVRALAVFVADGSEIVASAGDGGIVRLWDPQSRRAVLAGTLHHRDQEGNAATVHVLVAADHGNNTVLLSGGDDARVQTWNPATGEPIGDTFEGHHRTVRALVAARTDGAESTTVAVSGGGDGDLFLFRPGDSARIDRSRPRHAGSVHALARIDLRLEDNKIRPVLISAGADRSVRAWLWLGGSAKPFGKQLLGHRGAVRSVAAKAMDSGTALIVSGGDDYTVRLWKLDATQEMVVGNEALSGHSHPIGAVALDRDEEGVSYASSGDGSGSVRTWRITTEAVPESPLSTEPSKRIRTLAIDHLFTNTTVFVGTADGVRAWYLHRDAEVPPPWKAGFGPGVAALVMTRLGTRELVLTADDDAHVRVRDRADGREIGEHMIVHGPALQALAVIRKIQRPRLRVAVAAGDLLQIATLAPASGKSVTWSDEIKLSLGSKALALAWIDETTLAVGCEMGIVVLEVRSMRARG